MGVRRKNRNLSEKEYIKNIYKNFPKIKYVILLNMNNDIILIPKKDCLKEYVVYKNINYKNIVNKNKKKYVTKKNNNSVSNSLSKSSSIYSPSLTNTKKEKKYGGPKYIEGIIRNGFLYKCLDNCYFSKHLKLTENVKKNLEKNYKKLSKKELINDELIINFSCKKEKKIEILEKNGFPYNIWLSKCKKFYLKIEDIIKFKKGDKIKVLILDSDIYNFIIKKNKINKNYKPKNFFKENWAEITIDNNLQGLIKFQFQQEKEKPYKFNFHVHYIKERWHIVSNGNIYIQDFNKRKIINWEKLDKKINVGFGGHIILWDNLDKLPNIFLT